MRRGPQEQGHHLRHILGPRSSWGQSSDYRSYSVCDWTGEAANGRLPFRPQPLEVPADRSCKWQQCLGSDAQQLFGHAFTF